MATLEDRLFTSSENSVLSEFEEKKSLRLSNADVHAVRLKIGH